MGRRRNSLRLALLVALVSVLAAVVATTAYALAFDDSRPCPANSANTYVCPAGTVEAQYSVQLVGRGGCEPAHRYRVLSGALPPGLTLGSSGLISGRPTTAGKFSFWVELADIPPSAGGPVWCSNPLTAEREFSIEIHPRVLVATESAAPGTIGAPYSLALNAVMKTGPTTTSPPSSPLTWSVVTGALPGGLALNAATGVIAGTPSAEGTFSFVIRAALADGRSDTKALSITVRQPLAIQAPKPLAQSPAPTLWEVSVPFSAKLAPSGGSGTYTFSLASGALPTGMALAADGTVSGTPKAAGGFRATIRLADSEGRSLDYAANFGVAAKLAISSAVLRPGKVGRRYSSKLTTSGGVKPVSWKLTSGKLPKGIRFDRKLGRLLGIPKTAGTYRLTFQAKDSLGVTATRTLRLVVTP